MPRAVRAGHPDGGPVRICEGIARRLRQSCAAGVDEAGRLLSHDAIRNGPALDPSNRAPNQLALAGEVFLLLEVLGRQHNQHQQISQGIE